MRLGRVILSWVARNAFALGFIILILLVGRHLAPAVADWFGVQSEALRTVPAQQAAYAAASRDFEAYADRRQAEAEEAGAALAHRVEGDLRARREALPSMIARQEAMRSSPARLAIAAARGDSATVFEHYRAGAEVALLDRERRQIDTLLSVRSAERESLRLRESRLAAVEQLRTSHAASLAARREVERLEGRFLATPRNAFCPRSPLNVGCQNYRALVAARGAMEAAAVRNRDARNRIAAIARAEQGLARTGVAVESARAVLDRQRFALAGEIERLDRAARGSGLITAWRAVAEVLPAALLLLATAIATPLMLFSSAKLPKLFVRVLPPPARPEPT